MYLAIPLQQTCAAAWLEATTAVDAASGHEAYNVITGIEGPMNSAAGDASIYAQVDSFLRAGDGGMPLQAVANTIFPEALYQTSCVHGSLRASWLRGLSPFGIVGALRVGLLLNRSAPRRLR